MKKFDDSSIPASVKNDVSLALSSPKAKTYAASRLAKWFSIDLTIKIFGVTILEWHYPPLASSDEE